MRLAIAPAYTRATFEHDVLAVTDCLRDVLNLPDTPEAFATFLKRMEKTR